ncbi:MAG: MBL fold metallo-hydrolase [Candidatus Omnitrophica bacterium]|nr:MBL fold metallo-hydrolase [Candidatus Omnitrophota bacterium]
MRVTILGAGTAIPARDRSPSGLFIEAAGERLLIDAGPGTLQRLHAAGGNLFTLDRVFLTHYHLDHCLDLASLLFALRLPAAPKSRSIGAAQAGIPDRPPRAPLAVYGPPGLKRLYRRLNSALNGWLTPRGYALRLKEIKEAMVKLGKGTMRARWMRHSAPALGYRLEADGKRIAYSGDTDLCDAIVELGRDTHLLILECSVPDERKVAGHLTPTECGRIAASANCRHLVLTHFYPVFKGYDIRRRVRRAFRGRLTLARDLASFRL